MILPESSVFSLNKYILFQRDWVAAKSYSHHDQKLFPTDKPSISWPTFFFLYPDMNFQQKEPLFNKGRAFCHELSE